MKKMYKAKGVIEISINQCRKEPNENRLKKPEWKNDVTIKKVKMMVDCYVSEDFIKNEPDALEEILKMKLANNLKGNMEVIDMTYVLEENKEIE